MVRQRMSGIQRREQLIAIGREVFAERGFDGASMEEIAARAGVSKPVVYEHFGGKEGLYAVIVDREMVKLQSVITGSMQTGRSRARIEQAVVALLTYVEEETDAFQILVRDMKAGQDHSYSTLLNDAVEQVSHILGQAFERSGLNPKEPNAATKEQVAAHIVNLCWNGLAGMEANPQLSNIDSPPETLGAH
ncbi:TetR/AcrR family transcriptional regulator [Corynebacterium diphtheriae]|nr:TetR/AcrR family transcriptional regulator [Corynebacterium diphtheriae]